MKEVGIITLSELNDMAATMYGDLVKAVVDFDDQYPPTATKHVKRC